MFTRARAGGMQRTDPPGQVGTGGHPPGSGRDRGIPTRAGEASVGLRQPRLGPGSQLVRDTLNLVHLLLLLV